MIWNWRRRPRVGRRAVDSDDSGAHEVCEQLYAEQGDHLGGFKWYSDEPPVQLIDLLDRYDLPDGPALDVGCGPGSFSAFLVDRFVLTIDVDIAHLPQTRACHQHRFVAEFLRRRASVGARSSDRRGEHGARARPRLHTLPAETHAGYLAELSRVTTSDGIMHLIEKASIGNHLGHVLPDDLVLLLQRSFDLEWSGGALPMLDVVLQRR